MPHSNEEVLHNKLGYIILLRDVFLQNNLTRAIKL